MKERIVNELLAVRGRRGFSPARVAPYALAAVLALLLSGDRSVFSAPSVVKGIDPLDVLDFQSIPNILFVLDTSSSMGGTVADPNYFVGGDDVLSRLYQAKVAVRDVIGANLTKANFGVAQYGPGNASKKIKLSGIGAGGAPDYNRGPFIYVSLDGYNSVTDVGADGNTTTMGDAFARIFQPPTSPASSDVKYTDYAGLDDASGAACPASCLYNKNTGTTTCPAYCEAEFLRGFIATENGFGTPMTATTKAFDNPLSGRYYIKSRVFRNNVLYRWAPGPGGGLTTSVFTKTYGIPISKALSRGLKEILPLPGIDGSGVAQAACPAPPAGLLGDDIAAANDGTETRPCFQIELMVGNILAVTKKKRMTFYLASAAFGLENPNDGCPGGVVADSVQGCGHAAADDTRILQQGSLRLELPYANPTTGGVPSGLTATWPSFPATNSIGTNPNPNGGIQLGGDGLAAGNNTPIAATLYAVRDHFNNVVFPARPAAAAGKQKNFTVLIIDGDENCGGDPVAAARALYDNTPSPANRIETLVIVFPSGSANAALADQIALAGSGGTRTAIQGGTLAAQLSTAVNAALGQAVTGTFSAADTTVTESVFEFHDPMNVNGRYGLTQPLLFQSTFEMPGFIGHFRAYWNPPDDGQETSAARWDGTNDAGAKLLSRVTIPSGGAAFVYLHAGATAANIADSSALIKRRIYTTTRNGVFTPAVIDIVRRTAQADVRTLWPPTTSGAISGGISTAVAPADSSNPAGTLDTALGISALTYAQLQTQFGACKGSTLPTACTTSSTQLARAKREARESILAFIAGAQLKGGVANPVRDATTKDLVYEARPWILAETTLSAPAVVTPPLQSEPATHLDEYRLLRDGPRDSTGRSVNAIRQGFGLRNPDKDGSSASAADNNLKPAMSVVYLGTNEALHAFRAGPCLVCSPAETGGEELWAFVPFDQLGKLQERMQPQGRDPHTYMIASGLRFGEVFVPVLPEPGTFSESIGGKTVTGTGVWRTLMVFGRGIAGQHYTTLDITGPGAFTKRALTTEAPIVYWSRGNPDTQDGLTTGTKNNTVNTTEAGYDYNAYARMGETWSVPALAPVAKADAVKKINKLADASCKYTTTTDNSNARRPQGIEFLFYVGSGYPSAANLLQGTTFYALDAVTGDVVMASDVCDRSPKPTDASGVAIDNALVASPSVFTASQLVPGFVGNPAASNATRVYVADIHGRLWKFNTDNTATAVLVKDLGADQPVANGAALLNYNSDATSLKPHVYVETGNDRRFPFKVASPFKAFGFRDPTADRATTANAGVQIFALNIPIDTSVSPLNGYRGTTQPATAFNTPEQGRVFFVGTKYNPAGSQCVSTWDSILFAVGAGTGGAAYDFGISYVLTDTKAISVRADRGKLVIDQGLVSTPPPSPTAPKTLPGATGTGEVYVSNVKAGSPVCH